MKRFTKFLATAALVLLGMQTTFAASYIMRAHAPGVKPTPTATPAPAPSDPDYSSVSLLMHLDGNLTDAKGNAITALSTPVYASGEFGQALDFSTGNSLSIPSSAIAPGSLVKTGGTFTIEYWMYRTGTYGFNTAVGIGEVQATAGLNYWAFGLNATNQLTFYWYPGAQNSITASATVPANTWTYVALSVNNGTAQLYMNGNLVASGTISTPSGSVPVTIGSYNNYAFPGMIDEVRVTPGVARYSSNFTPPTAAFPNQ